MKKGIIQILAILVLSCNGILAQNDSSIETFIGTSFLKNTDKQSFSSNRSDHNLKIGFLVSTPLVKGFRLKTGLGINLQKLSNKFDDIPQVESEINHLPNSNPISFFNLELKTTHWYLDIPLLISYQLIQRKISPFIEAGIITSYYLRTVSSQKIDGEVIDQFKGKIETVKNFHYMGTVSLGLSYQLKEDIAFVVRTSYNRELKNTTNKATDIPKSHEFGISLGVLFYPF